MRKWTFRRGWLTGVALLAAVPTGCVTTWRTPPGQTAVGVITEPPPDRVRVTMRDGTWAELLFPWIEGDSLYATPDTPGAVPNSFRVAVTDVTQVEVAARSAGAALHAVTLMLVASVVVVILMATGDICIGFPC